MEKKREKWVNEGMKAIFAFSFIKLNWMNGMDGIKDPNWTKK
jgi:hypothetical protein